MSRHPGASDPSRPRAALVGPVLTRLGFAIGLASALGAALSGFGHRLGWWHFTTGFEMLRWAGYGALAALAAALLGLLAARLWRSPRRSWPWAVLGLALAVPTGLVPWQWLQAARSLPPIHDITTDTENPPRFEAALALRRDAPNPARYAGPEVARQQRRAYPDIRPAELDVPPARAFEAAHAVARGLGWHVHAADREAGRIEATDTTFWYGFKDDIVIRISGRAGGSRVDIRSVSRVGVSDVGTNARRVREFLRALHERLGGTS